MQEKARKELERAKALFYSWDLIEAYNILRRYYDRIPFRVESEHADYIAIFTRTLLELGKEFELKFYMSELEVLYQRWKTPLIGFQLAVVYTDMASPKIGQAKTLLEEVIRHCESPNLVVKAKLRLAYCYDFLDDDTASCRRIIDSIAEANFTGIEAELQHLVVIWQAKLLRDEKKYEECEALLMDTIKALSPKKNWYAYFSANLILARLYLSTHRVSDALRKVEQLRKIFEHRQFKTVSKQLEILYRDVDERNKMGTLSFQISTEGTILFYDSKRILLQGKLGSEKLLLILMRRKFLLKSNIVKSAYQRAYNGSCDDALVYYQVHNLRKLLKRVGVPSDAITKEGEGYRFIPEVKMLEEQL